MVYFGDLLWRSVGTLGHGAVHTFDNDTGPDDCNHARNGLFILYDPQQPGDGAKVSGAQLMDVTPTLLSAFGLERPASVQGMALMDRASSMLVLP
jgi:predicted AlkP superfamily phosphohydrolase/phosphomutase